MVVVEGEERRVERLGGCATNNRADEGNKHVVEVGSNWRLSD